MEPVISTAGLQVGSRSYTTGSPNPLFCRGSDPQTLLQIIRKPTRNRLPACYGKPAKMRSSRGFGSYGRGSDHPNEEVLNGMASLILYVSLSLGPYNIMLSYLDPQGLI